MDPNPAYKYFFILLISFNKEKSTCFNIERLEGRNFFKKKFLLIITAWIKKSMVPKELCWTKAVFSINV